MATANVSNLHNAYRVDDMSTDKSLLPNTPLAVVNSRESRRTLRPDDCSSDDHSETASLPTAANESSSEINNKYNLTSLQQVEVKGNFVVVSRLAEDPSQKPIWLFGKHHATLYARAVERGCVKDRGVKRTVEKIDAAKIIADDQSRVTQLLRLYLNEAREKNDATFLVRAYTLDSSFYLDLNKYMATGSSKEVYEKLCRKWSGYYTGTLMKNSSLEIYRYQGLTHRGMRITPEERKEYQVGKLLTNKAFQSTSKLYSEALRFANPNSLTPGIESVILKYKIRDRESALDIKSLSEHPTEEEVLMMPGCLFKVSEIDDSKSPTNITMEQISTIDA